MNPRKPAFGALPGIEVSVKVFRTEGPVIQRQGNVRQAQLGSDIRIGCNGQIAIIAILHEAAGKIAREAQLLIEYFRGPSHRCVLLIHTEISYAGAQLHLRRLRRRGNKIHHAGNGVRPI